jgi:predicted nuclease of predicted toxin-antitoxin system
MMNVRVKVDEDLPRQMADLFTERGYDATTVVGQRWQGLSDAELWPRVQQEGRWLVTADKGFADLRTYPPDSHAGVLLFRLDEESRRGYLELARTALQRLELEKLAGAVIVVTHRGIRIRKP